MGLEEWIIVERPGYLGGSKLEKIRIWDEKYGKNNWRLVWKIGFDFFDFLGACALYEDAYFFYFKKRGDILLTLISEACDVYDDMPSNVNSGLDYTKQETERTHIQDIAIRRSLVRLCAYFRGDKLIQIRDRKGEHPLSMDLSPGRVPFHIPAIIEKPELRGWWEWRTVESFYQSNKYLQIKK